MNKYKIKDLAERLQKEKTSKLKNKMLFMWIKQEVISLQEYNELVKLILYGVGSTFAVKFAQYIAEEHFRLVNVQNGTYYWKDETSLRTTEQLLEHFKNTRQ